MSKIPEGQSKRGTPSARVPNTKNRSKPDSIGSPGAGTAHGKPATSVATKRFQGNQSGGKNAGSASSVPDPSPLRGFLTRAGKGPKPGRTTSANRQRFGIDPGRNKLG